MNFTIYTFGDVTDFQAMLNAVAMVFNSSMFNPTTGAGVFVMGGLISLLTILFSTIVSGLSGRASFNPTILLVTFLIFFAGINIKSTVQINDVFSAKTTVVSNIPIIVAAPAGIISSAANGITQNIETAFSTTNGNYLTLGTMGFADPLKILESLKHGSAGRPVDSSVAFPYLKQSVTQFMLNCGFPAPNFDYPTMMVAPDLITYITQLNVAGITTYYNAANKTGVGMDCASAENLIANDAAQIPASPAGVAVLNGIIAANMSVNQAPTGGHTNGSYSFADFTSAWNGMTAGTAWIGQNAQNVMNNMLFLDTISNTWNCQSNAASQADLNTCAEAVMMRQGLEQMKEDSAGAGTMFTRTMIPLMNILLMLFYALSPIVLIVAVFSGIHGVKVIGSFLIFGVWTQSWMPVAAVINYYIQMQEPSAINSLAQISPAGMGMGVSMSFYDNISLKISLASHLLASTPMITMAIISGSMYSLTQLAKGGSDHIDQSIGAPDLLKTSAVAQVGSALSATASGGAIERNEAISGLETQKGVAIPKVDVSDGANVAAKNEENIAVQAGSQANAVIGKALSASKGAGSSSTVGEDIQAVAKQSNSKTWDEAEKLANEISSGTDLKQSDRDDLARKMTVGLTAGGGVPGMLTSLAGLKTQAGIEMSLGHQVSNEDAKHISLNAKKATDYVEAHKQQYEQAVSHDEKSGFSKKVEESFSSQQKQEISDAVSQSNTASKSASGMRDLAHSFKSGLSPDYTDYTNRFMNNPGYQENLAAVDKRLNELGVTPDNLKNVENGAFRGVVQNGDPNQMNMLHNMAKLYVLSARDPEEAAKMFGKVSGNNVSDSKAVIEENRVRENVGAIQTGLGNNLADVAGQPGMNLDPTGIAKAAKTATQAKPGLANITGVPVVPLDPGLAAAAGSQEATESLKEKQKNEAATQAGDYTKQEQERNSLTYAIGQSHDPVDRVMHGAAVVADKAVKGLTNLGLEGASSEPQVVPEPAGGGETPSIQPGSTGSWD